MSGEVAQTRRMRSSCSSSASKSGEITSERTPTFFTFPPAPTTPTPPMSPPSALDSVATLMSTAVVVSVVSVRVGSAP